MKRILALAALLVALGVIVKLGGKASPRAARDLPAVANGHSTSEPAEDRLLAKYKSPADRALVEAMLNRYRQNALAIERTDGLRGLKLLEKLDLEAIYLYEKHPNDFRRLRDSLTDESAADLLVHWSEYFGLKRADDTDRAILIAEIGRLSPSQRRIAARVPSALPLILAEPDGVCDLIDRLRDEPSELADALAILDLISLDRGAADLQSALRTLDARRSTAVDAFRILGPEGFALVSLYGPILDALGDGVPLDQSLIILRVNAEYVDKLQESQRPEAIASAIRHVAEKGLVEAVGNSPHALRLAVEFAGDGDRALAKAGGDAADVVYEDYADPALRRAAVEALGEYGPMALAMLSKYSSDTNFSEILRAHGARVIPPIARSDALPETLAQLQSKARLTWSEWAARGVLALSKENGQATIRTIKNDGLERVADLQSEDVQFYQFMPLYDLLHLGGVLTRGHSPTSGELTWALIDGCFVVADVLSLAAVQPEGAAAVEVARTQIKTATRESVKALGREAVEEATEAAAKGVAREGAQAAAARASRWWTVRLAGGTFKVLRQLPEALPRMSLAQLTDMGRVLCAKAGMRLTTWQPLRFLKDGREVVMRIPPGVWTKYVALQGVSAGVGVVAIHKMEEHLASRRPSAQ